MDCVDGPLDHELLLTLEEVSVTDPPEQKVVGPLAVILAVTGCEMVNMLLLTSQRVLNVASETLTRPVVVAMLGTVQINESPGVTWFNTMATQFAPPFVEYSIL